MIDLKQYHPQKLPRRPEKGLALSAISTANVQQIRLLKQIDAKLGQSNMEEPDVMLQTCENVASFRIRRLTQLKSRKLPRLIVLKPNITEPSRYGIDVELICHEIPHPEKFTLLIVLHEPNESDEQRRQWAWTELVEHYKEESIG